MKLKIQKAAHGTWWMGYGSIFLGTFASFEDARNSMFLWPSRVPEWPSEYAF